MAAWSSAAAPARAPARARPAPRPAARPAPRRAAARARTHHGIAWIVAVGALLAGVVALNVAVLRQNMTLDKLDRDRTQLRAENAALQSQLSSSVAAPRLQARASKLGLVPAPAEDTSYVRLTGR
jgi:hypothetical protein